jgi:hypothetical protein
MRVLAVDQMRHAVGCFAALKQERIPSPAHERVKKKHGAQPERIITQGALSHQHKHAAGKHRLVASFAVLFIIDEIRNAMRHHRPFF